MVPNLFIARHRVLSGFTVMELLAVVTIIGILAAILAPSWLSFLNRQDIVAANQKAVNVIRQGQTQASQQRQGYRVSFRTDGKNLSYSIHPSRVTDLTTVVWHDLAKDVDLQYKWGTFKTLGIGQYWSVEFDFYGNVEGVRVPGGSGFTGRVIFTKTNTKIYRCTFISTLIGGLRLDESNGCLEP